MWYVCVYSVTVGGLAGLAQLLFASRLHTPHLCLHPPFACGAHAPYAQRGPMLVLPGAPWAS